MSVLVKFNSGQELRLSETFDQVNQQLVRESAGVFNTAGDYPTRVVVFAANVEYIQELGDQGISV